MKKLVIKYLIGAALLIVAWLFYYIIPPIVDHYINNKIDKKSPENKLNIFKCKQLYNIKAPTLYEQRKSINKCFKPLVYTLIKQKEKKCDKGLFYKNVYTKSYIINIANLSHNNIYDLVIDIKQPKSIIYVSCDSKHPSTGVDSLFLNGILEYHKEATCGIVILSYKKLKVDPIINIYSSNYTAEYIDHSYWKATGYNTVTKLNEDINGVFTPLDHLPEYKSWNCLDIG